MATTHWQDFIRAAELSEATKKAYVTNVKRLQTILGGRELDVILANPARAVEAIERHSAELQTRKTLVSGVKAILKHVPGVRARFSAAADAWDEAFKKLDRAISDRYDLAEPNQREIDAWIAWPEVLAMENKLRNTEYASRRHLLLAMYSLIPPQRQDYGSTLLLPEKPSTDFNYLVLPRGAGGVASICITTRKTHAKLGTYRADLPADLTKIIVDSLKTWPRAYLFGHTPVEKTAFQLVSNGILQQLFAPRKVTVTTLRHSFINSLDFNVLSPLQLKQIAYAMGHEVGQQLLYRRMNMNTNTA